MLAGESAVGIGLVFGLLTPVSLLVAIFLNLNYLALAGVRPRDLSVNPAYQCAQGQNYTMIVSQLVLLALGAGSLWSLDAQFYVVCRATLCAMHPAATESMTAAPKWSRMDRSLIEKHCRS